MQKKRTHSHKKAFIRNNKPFEDGQIVAMNEYGDGEIHGYHKVIKIVRTVVGDQVRVELPSEEKRFVYGKLVKLLKPSDKRVNPDCTAFDEGCGGCQWLHFDYSEQLHWKTRILRDILMQRCHLQTRINDIIPMENPSAYRNKLSLRNIKGHFSNMQDFDDTVIKTKHCKAETIPNQQARQFLMTLSVPREILQVHVRSTEKGELGMHLFVFCINTNVRDFADKMIKGIKGLVGIIAQVKDHCELLAGKDYLEYIGSNLIYKIPLNGFFQTNYVQARQLLDITLKQLACGRNDTVLDLYCGCGFFTLPIATKAGRVLGIENNVSSVKTASDNALLNKLNNVQFQTSDVACALKKLKPGDWQLVLLDPPRIGCEEKVLQELIRLSPRRIVYVSCSPSALARDLKKFLAASYVVCYCQPIDMFPHTVHMETVVTLEKK
ncbi:MAG TPA: methyltransferase domain-containing protein [Chitinispirillaceae bacterium]|nr:methyltransferase domain-containing protein [Chitinispirillaceae bacterium]